MNPTSPAAAPGAATTLLDDLNDAQRAAVTFGEGPALVLAGAGTGKTRVLTRRIAWLIATRRARPSEILGLTFTEKAAQEMEERVDRLVPFGFADTTLCTFHAFGKRLLDEFGLLLGLPGEPRVLTEAESILFLRGRLFELPLDRLRPAGDPTRHLAAMVRHFGRLADEDIAPAAYAAHAAARGAAALAAGDPAAQEQAGLMAELAACYERYDALLLAEGLVDFAGLLTRSLALVRRHPAVRAELARRFRWILVDEFQDTNFAQFELVRAIAGERPNLTVVGDDDQSIYKFRGAAISNILGFRQAYPAAAQHVLVDNYRSTAPILEAAHRLIRHNDPERLEVRAGVDKRLRARGPRPDGPPVEALRFDTPSSEADAVAARIAAAVAGGARAYGDFAVLVRRRAAAVPVAQALAAAGVPFRVAGGGGLFERPEVVACLDGLAALADPTDDRALYFLAASEIYGVPATELARLSGRAQRRRRPLEEALREAARAAPADPDAPSPAAAATLGRLIADLDELRTFAHAHGSGETLYRFLAATGYLERLTADGGAEADRKVQNLARLFELARAFGPLARRDRADEFVRHLDLLREAGEDPRAAEPDADEDAVHVLTVHRAKGLEFPVVFLVGLEAGHFPTPRRGDPLPFPEALVRQELPAGDFHLMEERRLFYVGMTRAREELVLSSALDHGGTRRWKASPFVLEALDRPQAAPAVAKAAPLAAVRRHRTRPDPLAVALPPVAHDETLVLSHHQVDDWLTCPLKYKYAHVLRVPLLPHHSVGFGLALHTAIREHYRAARAGEAPSEDAIVAAFERAWTGEGFITREHEEQRRGEGRAAIRAFWRREREHPSRPALVEAPFRVALGHDELRGRFDRVDLRPEGPVIVDFKSSAVSDAAEADQRAADSLQLRLYALAYESEYGRRPAAVELHFIASGAVGRAPVSDDGLAAARAEVARAAAGIRAREYGATPGWRACGHCPFNAICPARARGAY